MFPSLRIGALLVVMTGTAVAADAPCGNYNDIWTACARDSDCIIGATGCGGAYSGVYNKTYVATANAYAACIAPRINCLMLDPAHDPSEPVVCFQGRCGFTLPGKR
ncbi:MAG: hypothetical protein WBK91_00835 [Alphaproteobacteria bacterium]